MRGRNPRGNGRHSDQSQRQLPLAGFGSSCRSCARIVDPRCPTTLRRRVHSRAQPTLNVRNRGDRSMLRLTQRVLIALLVGLSAASAIAAMPGDIGGKFKVNDDDPTKGIPSIEERNSAPIEFAHFLQDLTARAEPAFREKKWDRAVKYYEAIARTVPDRAFPYSRLCSSYAELGKIEIAAPNCQK